MNGDNSAQCVTQDDRGRAQNETLTALAQWLIAVPADEGKLVLP